MPEYWGVLERGHGDIDVTGGHLHSWLQVLCSEYEYDTASSDPFEPFKTAEAL